MIFLFYQLLQHALRFQVCFPLLIFEFLKLSILHLSLLVLTLKLLNNLCNSIFQLEDLQVVLENLRANMIKLVGDRIILILIDVRIDFKLFFIFEVIVRWK